MDTLIKNKQHIFKPGEYFRHCHAPTLAALADGSILAAWFAGTRENHVDVGIWSSRMRGGFWSEPVMIAKDSEWPCWNPVLHAGENGIVYLFYKVGQSPLVWQTYVKTSRDNGITFGEASKLVAADADGRGPVKNKLAVIGNRWLAPASRETDALWNVYVDISEDRGREWRTAPVPADHSEMRGPGLIQPTLWVSSGANVHMLARSSEGFVYRSDSEDGGLTWRKAYKTCLPNNNSGIDAAYIDGTLALVYNPVGINWGARTPIALSLSDDNGECWGYTRILDENLSPADREDGEFSYPAVIAAGKCLYICYTWRRKTIEFIEIEVKGA